MVSAHHFIKISETQEFYAIQGCMQTMNSGNALQVVSAGSIVLLPDGRRLSIIIHQALWNPDKFHRESLLQPQQVRDNNLFIDDIPRCSMTRDGSAGKQCLFDGNQEYPFLFDGYRCYWSLRKPSSLEEFDKYPQLILTSSLPYNPTDRRFTRRCAKSPTKSYTHLTNWQGALAFPPTDVTKRTLDCTTQMVSNHTLDSQERLRDHYMSRGAVLRLRRVNDDCYHDTFFSSVLSVRGFKMWQGYVYANSNFPVCYLMKSRQSILPRTQDLFREYGAPRTLISDNAPEQISNGMVKLCRDSFTKLRRTEPFHPWQNLAERYGGSAKAGIDKMFRHAPWAPLIFWCYAAEYWYLCRQCTAKKSLKWTTPWQNFFGETPDISRFRFAWFAPVYYLDTFEANFPRTAMKLGFHLGIATEVGDEFTYYILPSDIFTAYKSDNSFQIRSYHIINRGCVRHRNFSDTEVPYATKAVGEGYIVFTNRNGEELHDGHSGLTTQFHPDLITHSDVNDVEIPENRMVHWTTDDSVWDDTPVSSSEEFQPNDVVMESAEHHNLSDLQVNASSLPEVVATKANDGSIEEEVMQVPMNHVQADHIQAQTVDFTPGDFHPTTAHKITQDDDSLFDDETVMTAVSSTSDSNDKTRQIYDVNTSLSKLLEDFDHDSIDPEEIVRIISHRSVSDGGDFKKNVSMIEFNVELSSGSKEWFSFDVVRDDVPQMCAEYVVKNFKLAGDYATSKYTSWARKFLRKCRRAFRRYHKYKNFIKFSERQKSEEIHKISEEHRKIRIRLAKRKGLTKKRSKPGRNLRGGSLDTLEVKFGVKVPRTYDQAMALDQENKNTFWKDAIEKEISTLIHLQCFDIKQFGYKPTADYQFAPLMMVYEVKFDGRRKCRLVALGCVVDPKDLSTRATVVKGISVRLLDLIAARDDLKMLCGDIGNAFVTADTNEKVYTSLPPEFGANAGLIALLNKALYGLRTSAERFRTKLSDFFRAIGFKPTKFDRDVYMRMREEGDGYDYICTHVDDFRVYARNAQRWVDMIAGAFQLKSAEDPNYYLGIDYHPPTSPTNSSSKKVPFWSTSCSTYLKEALARVERTHGTLKLAESPLGDSHDHPELDNSPLLDEDNHRVFQSLIGQLQWLLTIGRPDLSFALSSLSRFGAAPREMHLDMAFHVYSYLKKYPDFRLKIDPSDLDLSEFELKNLSPTFLQDYPDASEDVPKKHFPKMCGSEFQTTILTDADHAHDQKTRKSMTGWFVYVGSSLVAWGSKRQSAIATSTYQAEFMALRTAVEEAITIRYYLRCLGVPVKMPTRVIGDNMSVIQSASDFDADLKKKHVAISFHFVREAIAAGIVDCHWIEGDRNLADINTKRTTIQIYRKHVGRLFWHPSRSGDDLWNVKH